MKEFKELYGLYSKDLFNYLLYLTNDNSLAEELVQETFYQAFKSIHRFQGKSKVKTWLYQIAKHVYYNQLRKNTSSYKVEHFHEEVGHTDNFDTPELLFEKKEEVKLLHSAIMELQEPYKQVVILRAFNELSFQEIGEILAESENWARVTFHRGKQKLQTILKKGESK
ncbi:MAG: RNA polymerase sigma factor [Bacillota bacterium]